METNTEPNPDATKDGTIELGPFSLDGVKQFTIKLNTDRNGRSFDVSVDLLAMVAEAVRRIEKRAYSTFLAGSVVIKAKGVTPTKRERKPLRVGKSKRS